jgi:NADPH:quinone reductase-like Zn-dependent oxidoreductase
MRLVTPMLPVDVSPVVVATAYGGPEVLTVIDETAAEPGPGQARIDVRASGVNPIDYKAYSGTMGSDPARLPMRPGFEAAGVVTAVGPDAVGPAGPVAVGDEVIAYRVTGGYAAQLVAPVQALTPKPPSLGWPEASGLMLAGATAWHALVATNVASGDTVLVHGASGGVGLMAVQLARSRGATVIGTASPARHDLLRDFGVIPVAYGAGLADRVRAAARGPFDVALDLVGSDEAVDVSIELVADRNRIATIAAARRGLELGIKALGGGPGADPGTELRNAARPQLARLAGEGALLVLVSQTFPLAAAAAAHRAIMDGHTLGKIALIP